MDELAVRPACAWNSKIAKCRRSQELVIRHEQANEFLRAKLEGSFLVPDDKRPSFTIQQNHCAVALPSRCAYVFELPMGKILHVDAVYPPVAIARHTDDHEF